MQIAKEGQKIVEQPKRTKEEIEAEFKTLCLQAGERQYRIVEHEAILEQINQRIFLVSQEFINLEKPKDPDPPGTLKPQHVVHPSHPSHPNHPDHPDHVPPSHVTPILEPQPGVNPTGPHPNGQPENLPHPAHPGTHPGHPEPPPGVSPAHEPLKAP